MSDHRIIIVRDRDNVILFTTVYGEMIQGAIDFKIRIYNIIPENMKREIINFIEEVLNIRVLFLR